MTVWVWPLLAGLLSGILSAWGIGGGTLLLVYLTAAAGLEQETARGINLLYFLPCAIPAVLRYRRQGLFSPAVWRWGVLGALPAAAAGVWLAGILGGVWLRRGFGLLLLAAGVRELLSRERR